MGKDNSGIFASLRRRATMMPRSPEVFTRSEKNILVIVKSSFAFSWGFLNAIISITSRFATIMTGNLVTLAAEVRAWNVEEMLLSLTLIIAYICAGVAYKYMSILFHQNRVVLYLIPIVVSLGVLADVLQYVSEGCSSPDLCTGNHLYFLTPVSILTGLVAAGYWTDHSDGVTTTLMTNHMIVFPTTVLSILLKECHNCDHLKEKSRQSVSIILSFFAGATAGDYAKEGIMMRYTQGKFTPVFTCFGIVITILCFMHHSYCTRFFEHHRSMQEMVERVNVRQYSTRDITIVKIDEESLEGIKVDKVASNVIASNITLSNFHEDPTEAGERKEKVEMNCDSSKSVNFTLSEHHKDPPETWNDSPLEKV